MESQIVSIKKLQRKLWVFTLFKVPLLFFCRPKIVHLNTSSLAVRIPLYWWTKNHINSMYFGVLTMGADLACGLLAMVKIANRKKTIGVIFKSVTVSFLMRAEHDVTFICNEGVIIDDMVNQAIQTEQRVTKTCRILAYTGCNMENLVASFTLELSIKLKS